MNRRSWSWPIFLMLIMLVVGLTWIIYLSRYQITPSIVDSTPQTPDIEVDTGNPNESKVAAESHVTITICIDPGHPSETNSGKAIQNGTTENHINWVISNRLDERLTSLGYEVVLTKQSEEEYVTNRRRAEIANEVNAALMLRLHSDTGPGSGFTFYVPDKEGTKDGHTGPPPEVRSAGRQAAEWLNRYLRDGIGPLKSRGVLSETHTAVGNKQGALTGSIFARVPVVTMEMGFLSNPKDAEFLKSENGQAQIATVLSEALDGYLQAILVQRQLKLKTSEEAETY